MKIIATVPIGRNGRQYRTGEPLDVSPSHARMYVLSKQARYQTEVVKPATRSEKTPAEPERKRSQDDTPQEVKPRKGRHRRRDMRAEDEADGEGA